MGSNAQKSQGEEQAMVDFLRRVEGPLVGLLIFLALAFGVVAYLRQYLNPQAGAVARTVRNVLAVVGVVGFLVYIVNAASVNSVPRGQLDRSILNERGRDLDNKVHQPQQETPKQEGEKKCKNNYSEFYSSSLLQQ